MSKIAVITGASGGIGRSISHQLCADGFDVLLVARDLDRLKQRADELGAAFPARSVQIAGCDVSHSGQVTDLLEGVRASGRYISVLVNGAGISGGGITAEISDALWLAVINTNLNGTFFVTREALRLDLLPKGGRIINIASTGGKQGVIHGAPYCASKHAMVGFTKALGLELARNGSEITVNAVCPGFVETEMAERVRGHYAKIWGTDAAETRARVEDRIPIGRYIQPDEVAAMVAYLASSHSSGVTAQALNVCGGLGNY